MPTRYTSGTMPLLACATKPYTATGAIGTMNTIPYTSRWRSRRLRSSCCAYPPAPVAPASSAFDAGGPDWLHSICTIRRFPSVMQIEVDEAVGNDRPDAVDRAQGQHQ